MTKKRIFSLIAAIAFALYGVWALIDAPLRLSIIYDMDIGRLNGLQAISFLDVLLTFVYFSLAVLFALKATPLSDKIPFWAFSIAFGALVLFNTYTFFNAFRSYKLYLDSFGGGRDIVIIFFAVTLELLSLTINVLCLVFSLLRKKALFFLPAALSAIKISVYFAYILWYSLTIFKQPVNLVLFELFGCFASTVTYLFLGFAGLFGCFEKAEPPKAAQAAQAAEPVFQEETLE